MTEASQNEHLFSADRPIERKTQDILARDKFVDSLSKAILAWRGKDSLVIGLNGPWGSGKTSIKNLVVEVLNGKADEVVIVDFNPWQWSGQDKLVESFFQEIGKKLRKSGNSAKWKRLAKKWRLYAEYLGAGSVVSSGIQRLVPYLLVISFLATWILSIPGWVVVTLLGVAAILSWSRKFAEALSSVFESRAAFAEKSLSVLKEDLTQEMGKTNKAILVVIDDLDRLTAEQSRLVFQLVKANADFPNVIYLLLFQKEVIEGQLNDNSVGGGREFLEKIVQMPFDVPKVDQQRIWRVLTDGLSRILENPAASERFDSTRYQSLFVGYLRDYFENLRDVNRYLGTLSFHAGSFMNGGVFEVNPVDLLALEVLRTFEPEVYASLPSAKPILTGSIVRASLFGIEGDEGKRIMKAILEKAPEDRRKQVESLIKELFPPAERFFEGGTQYDGSFFEQWYRELRVCHEYSFDRYFELTVSEKDLSDREMKLLLARAADRNAFLEQMKEYNSKGRISVVLGRLENYSSQIPPESVQSFVTALFDIGDDLPEEQPGMFNIDCGQHIKSIAYSSLKTIRDPDKRAEVLTAAVIQTTGIVLPLSYLEIELAKAGEKTNREESTVEDASKLDKIKTVLLRRIQEMAGNGKLGGNSRKARKSN